MSLSCARPVTLQTFKNNVDLITSMKMSCSPDDSCQTSRLCSNFTISTSQLKPGWIPPPPGLRRKKPFIIFYKQVSNSKNINNRKRTMRKKRANIPENDISAFICLMKVLDLINCILLLSRWSLCRLNNHLQAVFQLFSFDLRPR